MPSNELIIVPYHGYDWLNRVEDELEEYCPDTTTLFMKTGPWNAGDPLDTGARWPTGALLWVYRNVPGYDHFLLLQDSLSILSNPLPWFQDQWPGAGAVAWQLFHMDWDNNEQRQAVENRYSSRPAFGIFGPIFYTSRESLDLLDKLNLLPDPPTNRLESCATERAWAYAFEEAGLPVVGPVWNVQQMTTEGVGPLMKTFANRP